MLSLCMTSSVVAGDRDREQLAPGRGATLLQGKDLEDTAAKKMPKKVGSLGENNR